MKMARFNIFKETHVFPYIRILIAVCTNYLENNVINELKEYLN